jgi:hypothetical protein
LADLRSAQHQPALYTAPSMPAPPAGSLSFVQLTPTPLPPQAQCCLSLRNVQLATEPASDVLLLRADAEDLPLVERPARRSWPGKARGIALAIAPRGAIVSSVTPQALLIRWPHRAAALRVTRCTSEEGLHVRVTTEGREPPATQHFYVPLGMGVERSCSDEMTAPPR